VRRAPHQRHGSHAQATLINLLSRPEGGASPTVAKIFFARLRKASAAPELFADTPSLLFYVCAALVTHNLEAISDTRLFARCPVGDYLCHFHGVAFDGAMSLTAAPPVLVPPLNAGDDKSPLSTMTDLKHTMQMLLSMSSIYASLSSQLYDLSFIKSIKIKGVAKLIVLLYCN
jgi:hypothetical protein